MPSRSLSPARTSRTPLWLTEGLDIVQRRAVALRIVVAVVCLLGLALAFFAPGIVPPTWQVGAAVALAALLLGLAVAIAIDAADLTLRGPRHVRAAGGELVAVVPTLAAPADLDALAAAVLDARAEDAKLILGLSAAGRDARRVATVTDTLAVALAQRDVSVLRIDLASGREERDGLFEVSGGGRRLGTAVDFEPGGLNLARLGAGRDLSGALAALRDLPGRLPRDLDVLVVALPTAASRASVEAAAALDHVLIVAERDTTSRVDLIAGLDALESVGLAAQVVLVDDVTAGRVIPATARPEPEATPDPASEHASEESASEVSAAEESASEVSAAEESAPGLVAPAVSAPGLVAGASEPVDPIVPDPDATPVVPEPDPAPIEPNPDPVPFEPDPEPVPFVPDPEPAPFEPEPLPGPVSGQPPPSGPTASGSTASGPTASGPTAPEPVVPEPAPFEPDPEPEPHVPDPARPAASAEPPDVNLTPIPGATTRIRRIEPVHPFDPDDDPLRTTAQLAVLIDDLEARDGR